MDYPILSRDLLKGEELQTFEHIANDLELALVTVQDVIDRNCDGAPAEDSYIGVNLALYMRHTEATLMRFRQLLHPAEQNDRNPMTLTKSTRR